MNHSDLRHARILIVEDNLADVALIKHFFAHEKISNHMRHASSLREAVHIMEHHPVDICFVDVQLPDGNGFDFVRQLNAEEITIVMLSGGEDMQQLMQAKGLGAAAYITKPLTKSTLDRLIKELRHLKWSIVLENQTSSL